MDGLLYRGERQQEKSGGRRRVEAHSGAGEQFKAAGKKEVDGVHPVYGSGKGKQASF